MIKTNQLICHFLCGFFVGVFEEIFGERFICEEVMCVAKQNPYCEFRLNKL